MSRIWAARPTWPLSWNDGSTPFTFGEAAYAAQGSLSWQTIVVGDPLYAPNRLSPNLLGADLERRKSKLLEWLHLRLVNYKQANELELDEVITLLESSPLLNQSAVLTEKLGDLLLVQTQTFGCARHIRRGVETRAFSTAKNATPAPSRGKTHQRRGLVTRCTSSS